jgi:hypothetical protein
MKFPIQVVRGEEIMLSCRNHDTWVLKTEAELDEQRARDHQAGRFLDDGGEPILYGPYTSLGSLTDAPSVVLRVTSLRPKWAGYSHRRRPRALRAGWCPLLKREVLFQVEL